MKLTLWRDYWGNSQNSMRIQGRANAQIVVFDDWQSFALREEFISQGTDNIGSYQVALIDEFSMISKSNFKDINQAVWNTPTKIIFVGDATQLPPVGESEPIIATHEYIQNEATLSSIVRYDGDIAKVAESIRSNRIYNQQLYPFQTTSDKTITCLSRNDWLKCAISYFKSDLYIENPDTAHSRRSSSNDDWQSFALRCDF